MRRPVLLICAFSVFLMCAPTVCGASSFVPVFLHEYTVPQQAHGITFDGTDWRIVSPDSGFIGTYDGNFSHIGSTTVSGHEFRGLAFDNFTGTLFATENQPTQPNPSRVVELSLGGAVLQTLFTTPDSINAIAADNGDGSLWVAGYTGLIEHRSLNNTLLGTIQASEVTGIATDAADGVLFVAESTIGVYEFRYDGTNLGVLPNVLPGGGLGEGIDYVPQTGRLYFDDQSGDVAEYQVESVPEPTSFSLVIIAVVGLQGRRRQAIAGR